MPDFNIDFSAVEADSFTVVPPGNYDVTVKSVTMGRKEAENDDEETFPYLRFEMAIADGDHAGRILFFYASFAPERVVNGTTKRSSLPRTKALLESFGVDVAGNVKLQVDPASSLLVVPDLVGEPAKVRVRADQYEGEPSAKVSRMAGTKQPAKRVAVGAGASGGSNGKSENKYK